MRVAKQLGVIDWQTIAQDYFIAHTGLCVQGILISSLWSDAMQKKKIIRNTIDTSKTCVTGNKYNMANDTTQ